MKRGLVRGSCTLALAGLFLVLTCIRGKAQANSNITGIITDQSGAVLAGATITATDAATGTERATISSGTGLFDLGGLNPATYDMKIIAQGFGPQERKGIVVNVSSTVRVDVTLSVGAETQTVIVEANPLVVQADSNVISTLINEQQITSLATNGRNVVGLAALGLGVSANLGTGMNMPTSVGSSFAISFNGLNQTHNIWLIDGGEAYDRGSGGKMSIMPSQDALSEFQVLGSNYPPDYGISSGGTVSMAIKSGSQEFHGELWEFDRNDALQAHNYFDNNNGQHQNKPKLRLNIFGFNGGGPVFIPHIYNEGKKKTFFFYNQEWRRIIQGTSPNPQNAIPANDLPVAGQDFVYTLPRFRPAAQTQIYVPIVGDAAFNANLQAAGLTPGKPFPENKIPASMLDPNAILFAKAGAVPVANTSGDQYSQSVPAPTFVHEEMFRVDHNFNDKWMLMGHFIHDAVSQDYAVAMWGNDSYPTVGNTFANPSYSTVVKLTGVLNPSVLLEAAFNYDGNKIAINNTGIYKQPSGWAAGTYFTGQNANNRLPVVNLNSWGTWYDASSWPWKNAAEDYAEVFSLSVTHQRHAMKFGGGYNRYTKNQQLFGRSQGQYQFADSVDANGVPSALSGDSYVDMLLGLASNYQQMQNQDIRHYVNNTTSLFAMDNWHISPRLSIQFGLRYDALPHAWERNNRISNFDPTRYQSALMPTINPDGALDPSGPGFQSLEGTRFYMNGVTIAGQAGVPRGLVNNYYQTIQPRVGFSLDLFGDGKTVLRGGFGTFFERMQGNDIYNVAPSLPFSNTPAATNVFFSNPSRNWATGGTAATPTFPQGMTTLQAYYPAPTVAQYSLGIQHELLPSLIWVSQYVGNSGRHQNVIIPINTYSLDTSLDDRWHTAQSSNYAAAHGGAGPLAAGYTERLNNYPGFANINQQSNQATTNYNAFQTGLRQQNKFGLTFEADYTYSHQIDTQINSQDLTQVSNPFNLKYDRGSGALDRRHMVNINYVYKLPIMQHSSGITYSLLGGWELAGTALIQSGLPWFGAAAPGGGYPDTIGLGGAYTNRPNASGKPRYTKGKNGAGTYQWVSNSVFSAPTPSWLGGPNLGFGNAGRDIVVGPRTTSFSTSLYKTFVMGEHASFQFRAESFNTFNHTMFSAMQNNANNSNFGQVSQAADPRTFELGGKLIF